MYDILWRAGADPGFFKEGVVSMRVQGKRPRAKGIGEGEGEGNVHV